MTVEQSELNGIEPDRVGAWMERHLDGAVGPFTFELIKGGRSNLTYLVTDAAGARTVLRRPPLGHVLESAHDMGREHRIISALAPSSVPVASPLAYCDDAAVTGAPFYVMSFVEGAILRDEAAVEAAFAEPVRAVVAESLIDVLADLHAVAPDAVGLGDLGRRGGYTERQLRRWHRQWRESTDREVPEIAEVHRRLSARVPAQRRLAIVHGDYRIDNIVFAANGEVAAVLDWELCTLGDPMADLGLLMVYWVDAGDDRAMPTGSPTALPGFPGRRALLDRYADRTGDDVDGIDFFIALGYWKLACIFEGIRARHDAGAMGANGAPREDLEAHVGRLAAAALDVSGRLR